MQTQPARQTLQPAELIPVIGYIRVSTWFEEKISDELQKAAIEEAARRRGRRVVKWVPDLDATGRNFKRRIMEAISAVESSTFDGAKEIWVWKYSRFGRNRHGVAINLARVEHAGGELISATEEIDATTATGRFTRGMLFELAAFESDRIGESWRETHEYRRTHGLPATGGERFGYVWHQREIVDGVLKVAEHYEPNPETHEAVRAAYEDYSYNDATFRSLAEHLNGSGLRNPGGKRAVGWDRVSVQYFLDSGFAAGLLHVHRNEIACPRRAACKPARGHYGFIPGAQPSIISDELWADYVERRGQRKVLPPAIRVPKYPYSGITKCGLCGGGATVQTGRPKHGPSRYRCNSRYGRPELGACTGSSVAMHAIERTVLEWLAKAAAEIDHRTAGVVLIPKPAAPSAEGRRRERVVAEIAKVQKGLDRASMAHAMGDMPRDSYLRVRDDLVAKRERLDAELASLEVEEPKAAWEVRGAVVRRLLEEWETLSVSSKRDLLSLALEQIRIYPPGSEVRVECIPRPEFVF